MVDPIDEFPLAWSDPRVRGLRDTLATTFFRRDDIVDLAQAAGISPADLNLDQPARRLWSDVLDQAAGRQLLRPLIAVVTAGVPAAKARIGELLSEKPLVAAPSPAEPVWRGFGNERQIVAGQQTLLDVVFLEHGLHKAKAVCRLTVGIGNRFFYGTAFRVDERTLLTNHHVLHDWERDDRRATWVHAEFGFEVDIDGNVRQPVVVRCDTESILADKDDDFAVITTSDRIPDDAPVLPISTGAKVSVDDRVYIVQHPQGLPKKIAMLHNLVRHADDQVVQYWTDTEQGSSGSPVFDEQWRVVALHHRSVEVTQDDRTEFRNQGRSIGRVAERLAQSGVRLA